MKYMLMLFEPDTDWDAVSEDEQAAALEEHGRFVAYLREHGIAFSGEALRPSSAATTLRIEGADRVVSDGPYVELKENLGGFYIIDVTDMDAALEVAKRCPTGTGIEIRPIWDTSG